MLLSLTILALACALSQAEALKILLTNECALLLGTDTGLHIRADGLNSDTWGTANVRALYGALKDAGHQVLMAAPATQQSGQGDATADAVPLESESEFGLLPAGAPETGCEDDDPNLCYVNTTPVSSVRYALANLTLEKLGSDPNLLLAGLNEGANLNLVTRISGTFNAAKEGVLQGLPSIAVSGAHTTHRPFTELGGPQDNARVYAGVALRVLNAVIAGGGLPPSLALNINLPRANAIDSTEPGQGPFPSPCADPAKFKFTLSKIYTWSTGITEQCGDVPGEATIALLDALECRASISPFNGGGGDVSAADRKTAVRVLGPLLSCS